MKTFNFFLLILLVACASVPSPNIDKVTIAERFIILNGEPYFIKGICYHPVPVGETKRNFKNIDQDLELMIEAGINTIRFYEPVDNIEILNKISNFGIKVIIGFGYDQNGIYDIKSGTFIDYVQKYKSHKSILIWELGNEYNYHHEWFENNIQNWYKSLKGATDLIHKFDKNHPVSTAHGDLPTKEILKFNSNLDLWGLNVYRWDNPAPVFDKWAKISTKPVYLSEAGADSFMKISKNGFVRGENQNAQAQANGNIIDGVFSKKDISSGVFIFSFTDGLWKAGNPSTQDIGGSAPGSTGVPYDGSCNEEFWGIVDINRKKKTTFDVIRKKFTSFNQTYKSIKNE